MSKVRVAEYLNIDLDTERWHCVTCDHDLGSAHENYKKGCLVAARDPREIHNPGIAPVEGCVGFAPDPQWCQVVEFCCPGCGTMIEVEYLPPGHPVTHDTKLDIASLKLRFAEGKGAKT